MGIFVTKNPQLYNACVAHGDHPDPTKMRDVLIKSKINMNSFIHIDPALINNGGLFAGNTAWRDSILDHESSTRIVVFWQVGDSYLQSGDLAYYLFDHNKWYNDQQRGVHRQMRRES